MEEVVHEVVVRRVVREPACTTDHTCATGELGEVRLARERLCFGLDADGSEVVDDDRNDRLVSGVGVELDRDRPVLYATFGNPLVIQRLGLSGVVCAVLAQVGLPARDAFGNDARRRRTAAVVHRVVDLFTVDGRRDRLAQLEVRVAADTWVTIVDHEVVRTEDADVESGCPVLLGILDASRRDVGVVAFTGFERVVPRVGIGLRAEDDRIEAAVPGVSVVVTLPALVAHHDDFLVRALRLELVRPVAEHHLVLPFDTGIDGRLRNGEEQLEARHRVEVRVRRVERHGEGARGVVGHDSRHRVGRTVEALGATIDEGHEVAVVAGEVGGALPGVLEGAGVDLFTVAELCAFLDGEGPDAAVFVRLDSLGDQRND